MPIDRDILSKVKRLTAEKSGAMTADQLFTSSQFLSYAQSAINSVTGQADDLSEHASSADLLL